MSALTLDDLSARLDRQVRDDVADLFGPVEIPVHTAAQSQGDLRVRPLPAGTAFVAADATWTPLTDPAGVVALPGVHDHVLTAGPDSQVDITHDIVDPTGLTVVGVRIGSGAAYVWHTEHGGIGVGPGTYALRRQREAGITAEDPATAFVAD